MYVLHNRQVHSYGTHLQILDLNSCKVRKSFISEGTIAHILGPRNDKVSVPCKTVLAEFDLKELAFLKDYKDELKLEIFNA